MNTVFDVLIKQLDESASSVNQALCTGSATDFPEYRYLCGQYRGLLVAKNLIKDLAKNYQEDYDNE